MERTEMSDMDKYKEITTVGITVPAPCLLFPASDVQNFNRFLSVA
jgi:hypothetical protein